MKHLLVVAALFVGLTAQAESAGQKVKSTFLSIGNETVQLVEDEGLAILKKEVKNEKGEVDKLGVINILGEALSSPKCFINDVKDKTLRFPFCFAEVAGEIVSIAIQSADALVTTPIIYVQKVSSELLVLVSDLLEMGANSLKAKGHRHLGAALMILSDGIRLIDDAKNLALKGITVAIHYVAKGATTVVRFVVRLPEKVVETTIEIGKKLFDAITDMTPATEPYEPSKGDGIFAGPQD